MTSETSTNTKILVLTLLMFTLHIVKVALVGYFIGAHKIDHQKFPLLQMVDEYDRKTINNDNVGMGSCDKKYHMKMQSIQMKVNVIVIMMVLIFIYLMLLLHKKCWRAFKIFSFYE